MIIVMSPANGIGILLYFFFCISLKTSHLISAVNYIKLSEWVRERKTIENDDGIMIQQSTNVI